jgi:hypothetical protein
MPAAGIEQASTTTTTTTINGGTDANGGNA